MTAGPDDDDIIGGLGVGVAPQKLRVLGQHLCHSQTPNGSRLGYNGCAWASASTRLASSGSAALLSVAPAISVRAMMSATSLKAWVPKPRVVSAGVPIRSPEVTIGGRGSHGTALRLTVMSTSCSRSSPC